MSQVRKRKSHFVYTGKTAMLTDVRLRDNTKYLIEASKREARNPRIECDNAECPNKHYFLYEIWKLLAETKKRVNKYWIFNPEFFFPLFDSWDIPAPADVMSKEQLERIAPRITNLGLEDNNDGPKLGVSHAGFLVSIIPQMLESNKEFQDKIWRPYQKIKLANKNLDFKIRSTSTGLVDAVIWSGKCSQADRNQIFEIAETFKANHGPVDLPGAIQLAPNEMSKLEGESRWESFFVEK